MLWDVHLGVGRPQNRGVVDLHKKSRKFMTIWQKSWDTKIRILYSAIAAAGCESAALEIADGGDSSEGTLPFCFGGAFLYNFTSFLSYCNY